jgi:hypothetical protein
MLNMLLGHPSNKRIDFMDTIRFVEPIGRFPLAAAAAYIVRQNNMEF